MQRVPLVIAFLCCFHSLASAQKELTIPVGVQKHMEKMVGFWTFEGSTGDKKFTGQETIRLTNEKTAMIQEGVIQWPDKKEHYTILTGWDGSKKTTLVRAFTSEGVSWAGEWKTLKNGSWEGSASDEPATFSLKGDTMRYEDVSTGDSGWKAVYTRKAKKPTYPAR